MCINTDNLTKAGKVIITIFLICCLIPILILFILGFETRSEIRNFEQQLFECPLPFESTLLAKDSAHGRIDKGSGNQTDYSAIILIESPLSLSAVEEHYTKALSEARSPMSWFAPSTGNVELFVIPVTEPYYQASHNELHPFYFECLEDREDFSGLYYIFMRH